MRLQQLHEASDGILTKYWTSGGGPEIVRTLKQHGDDSEMLSNILDKAIAKHAETDPAKLFNFLQPIIHAAKTSNTSGWNSHFHDQVNTLLSAMTAGAFELGPAAIKQLLSKVPLADLRNRINRELAMKIELALKKHTRTKDEEDFDDEVDRFIFLARPAFKEEPEGSGKFHKTLEIENLVKVDPYDVNAHKAGSMLQLRARFQGGDSEVWSVTLPKGLTKGGSRLDDWLIELIDNHKTRLR